MVKQYRTIYEGGSGEVVEKKSRFIVHTQHVASEEEALAFVESIRRKYWDARHNCYAFCIGKQDQIQRCSDDGEPAQTAGRPILSVLSGEKLCDSIIVVTRYFGGTLLGTGGLVRAYGSAAALGVADSVVIDKYLADKIQVITDYTMIGKVQYLIGQEGYTTLESEYGEQVRMVLLIPVEDSENVWDAITECTNGQAVLSREGRTYFAVVNKEVLLFEE